MTQSQKRSSQIRHTDKGRRSKSPSHARSIGSIRKHDKHEESAISSMQQLHLLRKQKIFLLRQEKVFQDRILELHTQISTLDEKIEEYRGQAEKKFHDMDDRDRSEVQDIMKGRSKTTSSQKRKNSTNSRPSSEEGISVEY